MEKESSFFYTLKGYSLLENNEITTAMEDYLEMIYRFHSEGNMIRINSLAQHLHVKPSSASKMADNLKSNGLVSFEKYGAITLTEKGIALGQYLLFRHNVLNRFFCFLNQSQEEIKLVEKVEHFIDSRTISNLEKFLTENINK